MKLVSKISMKTIGWNKAAILEQAIANKESEISLARVIGIASGIKTGEGDNGPYTAILGQFKATNLLTGEEFKSGKCFLPNVANDLVVGALMGQSNVNAVEFGFDITAAYDESSATSYIFNAVPLVEASEADPLAALEEKMGGTLALEDKSAKKTKKK